MHKVDIIILTRDRAALLKQALLSVAKQSFLDYGVVIVNDGSADDTEAVLKSLEFSNLKTITHEKSLGITASRQEALLECRGEYVAILDDDDEWLDEDKLQKQAKYLDDHKECVLVGGGIEIEAKSKKPKAKSRPETDPQIRKTMLFRNNFFTSTVMFRRQAALQAGGFRKDQDDLAEDYDLWLRMGQVGQMHNFREAFTLYRQPNYNKEKFGRFLQKQSRLIRQNRGKYPGYGLAQLLIRTRLLYGLYAT